MDVTTLITIVATKTQCENITLPLAAVQVVLFAVFILFLGDVSETNPQMLPFLELEKVRSNYEADNAWLLSALVFFLIAELDRKKGIDLLKAGQQLRHGYEGGSAVVSKNQQSCLDVSE